MTFWLGKPALGLVALPSPLKGLTPTLGRASTIHEASSGARSVDIAPRSRRTYSMAWMALDQGPYSTLEEFFTGARGTGPFALLDPGRRNHLTVNQSSAGSSSGDASGFAVLAGSGETVTVQTARVQRGPRALRWLLPGTVTAGVLDLDPPFGLLGWPTPAGQPWTWSGSVQLGGVVSSVTVTPVLSWRGVDGAELAATLGTPVAATPGAWTAFVVSLAAPPAGALYVRPQLRIAPATLATSSPPPAPLLSGITPPVRPPSVALSGPGSGEANILVAPVRPRPPYVFASAGAAPTVEVFIDSPQLDMFGTARTWVQGTGVPQVSMLTLDETYVMLPTRDATATFVEVGS